MTFSLSLIFSSSLFFRCLTISFVHATLLHTPQPNPHYHSRSSCARATANITTGRITEELPYDPVPGNFAEFVRSGKIPGMLKLDSFARRTGAVSPWESELPTDFRGVKRGSPPNIGALED